VETIQVSPGTDSVATPDIATGEQLIAVFLAPVRDGHVSLRDAKQLPLIVKGRLQVSPPLEFEKRCNFLHIKVAPA